MTDKPLPDRPRDSIVTTLTYPETVVTQTPGLRAAPGPPPPLPTQISVGYERSNPTAQFHPYRLHRISPILSVDTSSSTRASTPKSIWPPSFRRKNSTGSAISKTSTQKDKGSEASMGKKFINGWKLPKWGSSSSTPAPPVPASQTYKRIGATLGDPYADIHPISTGYPRDTWTPKTAPQNPPTLKESVPIVQVTTASPMRTAFPQSVAYTRSEYPQSELYTPSVYSPSEAPPRSGFPRSEAYTTSQFPRSEVARSEFLHSEAARRSEYPQSEYPQSEYPQSEYPKSEYPRSEYPRSEVMSQSEYPRSEAYTKSDYPRSEAQSIRSTRSGHHKRRGGPPPPPPIPTTIPSSSRRRNNRAPSRAATSIKSWKTFPEPPPSTIGDTTSHYQGGDQSVLGDNAPYTDAGSDLDDTESRLEPPPPMPSDFNLESPVSSPSRRRHRSRTNTITTLQTTQTNQTSHTRKSSRTGRSGKTGRTGRTVETEFTESSGKSPKYNRHVGTKDGRRYSHKPFHYFHRHSTRYNQSAATLTNASSMRNPSQIIRPGAPAPMSVASTPSIDTVSDRPYLPSRWARIVRLFRDFLSLPWRGDVSNNGPAPGITKTYNFRSGGGMGSGISPRPKRDSRIPRIPWYRPRVSQFPVAQGATVVPDISEVFPRGIRGAGVGTDGSGTPTNYRMDSSATPPRMSPTTMQPPMQQRNPVTFINPNIQQQLVSTPSSGSHSSPPNNMGYFFPMHHPPSTSASPPMHKHPHALIESYQTSPVPGVGSPMSFPDGSSVSTPPAPLRYPMSPILFSGGGPPSNSSGHSAPGIIIQHPGSGPIWVPTEPTPLGPPQQFFYIVPGPVPVPVPGQMIPGQWPEPQPAKPPSVATGNMPDMPIGSAV
ncbi:hypothetical protein FRC02_010396 [Tulasnella sp. 418]|nr:hypothetical protein FRC02_010396 [Tulasnella sp. 418]